MKSWLSVPVFLSWLIIVLIFIFCPSAWSNEDYKFLDQDGNEIVLPWDVNFYTLQNPGPWSKVAHLHEVKVSTYFRHEGLENIRVVALDIPHPMHNEKLGTIQKIYLLDKDRLIIGFYDFSFIEKQAKAKIKINGVINYVQIFIVCSKHEGWKSEARF